MINKNPRKIVKKKKKEKCINQVVASCCSTKWQQNHYYLTLIPASLTKMLTIKTFEGVDKRWSAFSVLPTAFSFQNLKSSSF